jgi:hypothetical protein
LNQEIDKGALTKLSFYQNSEWIWNGRRVREIAVYKKALQLQFAVCSCTGGVSLRGVIEI